MPNGICRATRFRPVTPKHAFLWSTFIVGHLESEKAEEKKKKKQTKEHIFVRQERNRSIATIINEKIALISNFEIVASLVNVLSHMDLVERADFPFRSSPIIISYLRSSKYEIARNITVPE